MQLHASKNATYELELKEQLLFTLNTVPGVVFEKTMPCTDETQSDLSRHATRIRKNTIEEDRRVS